MPYRITSIEAVRYPVLRVTFEDGLCGEYDVTRWIGRGSVSEPLKNQDYFKTVEIAPNGRSFGWNLEGYGKEVDFCADATRFKIEAALVEGC